MASANKAFFNFIVDFITNTYCCFYSKIFKWVGKKTKEKLTKITILLEDEKTQNAIYPKDLKSIIRNNPLRKNIYLDYYKNEFVYSVSKDSLNYSIIAIGKDQKLNTSDDIKITN